MEEFVNNLPSWFGTAPQWAVLGAVIIALIKTWPIIQQQLIGVAENKRGAYAKRIKELEDMVKECERKCDERETHFKAEIDSLKEKINNEAWQRVQSEISLVNTLISVVDAPQLKVILEALQRRSSNLPGDITALGGPLQGDTHNLTGGGE